eukprot:scaffold79480_cov20-Tisochrysis_lutea.AAC.1
MDTQEQVAWRLQVQGEGSRILVRVKAGLRGKVQPSLGLLFSQVLRHVHSTEAGIKLHAAKPACVRTLARTHTRACAHTHTRTHTHTHTPTYTHVHMSMHVECPVSMQTNQLVWKTLFKNPNAK